MRSGSPIGTYINILVTVIIYNLDFQIYVRLKIIIKTKNIPSHGETLINKPKLLFS